MSCYAGFGEDADKAATNERTFIPLSWFPKTGPATLAFMGPSPSDLVKITFNAVGNSEMEVVPGDSSIDHAGQGRDDHRFVHRPSVL